MDVSKLNESQCQEALLEYAQNLELEIYQAELVKLQQHVERYKLKLIVLFEGRDAARILSPACPL